LTRRQEEVLRLVATGLTNKEVAAQLGLSVHTIETHLHSIYGKIGVVTRGAAIRFAVDHGLVEPESREVGDKILDFIDVFARRMV
jgi:DNA-binding CsgD family transcriptional regulator